MLSTSFVPRVLSALVLLGRAGRLFFFVRQVKAGRSAAAAAVIDYAVWRQHAVKAAGALTHSLHAPRHAPASRLVRAINDANCIGAPRARGAPGKFKKKRRAQRMPVVILRYAWTFDISLSTHRARFLFFRCVACVLRESS